MKQMNAWSPHWQTRPRLPLKMPACFKPPSRKFERKRSKILADERNQLAHRVEERTADLSLANSDLERALRVKDEFLASMSHELRTPLTGILGLSEILQLKTYGELSEKQIKAVKISRIADAICWT